MVNLEWYRTFKEIYETGTLTKAAVALYSSQPGVSVHLNALEAYVGKKLFERTSRRMIPTEDGKVLYECILEPLKALEKAEQHFKRTTNEKNPSLNIGLCSELFQAVLESEIPGFKFDLMVRFGENSDLIRDLDKGLLDLVITPQILKENKSTISYTPFAKEQIVLIAGAKTGLEEITGYLKQKKWKDLEDLLSRNIWYSSSNEVEYFRQFWFKNFNRKPSFKPNYIFPSITSIIRCLENGNGFSIIPEFLCRKQIQNGTIHLVWTGKEKTENNLYFASRKDMKYKTELEQVQSIFKSKMQ